MFMAVVQAVGMPCLILRLVQRVWAQPAWSKGLYHPLMDLYMVFCHTYPNMYIHMPFYTSCKHWARAACVDELGGRQGVPRFSDVQQQQGLWP
jgi:hypothetical protein